MDTCKECSKQLDAEKEYFNLNIGDETERKWNKNKFNLCVDCWGKKKEGYKPLITLKKDKLSYERKIVVWKMIKNQAGGSMEEIGNCLTCKKWDDEYEVRNRHYNYCSLNCEKNKDKDDNNDDPERAKTQLRQRIQELEKLTNRTSEQEQELKEKREELAKLEGQNTQQPQKTNYTPWIIGGVILVGIVGILTYYFLKKDKKNHDEYE